VQIRWGDPEYLDVYGIKLLAGRNVAPGDTIKEFIINNLYARLLGFQKPDDAIGRRLNFNGKNVPIVGVMQDFHDQSMHAPISPLVFAGSKGSTFHVRLKHSDENSITWQRGIDKIQHAYKNIYPEEDFNYAFFDDTIARMYENEQNTSILLDWSAGLTILISCLGLLGLVIYTTNSRLKEIGIRKVLGASVAAIVSLLSKDFLRLVIVACLIASPIAWWATYKWLQDFAYRTTMNWWVFFLSGSAMLLISLVTLSTQTIKAAIANPVKSLRTE
jgi:putative ABC transport system permease protein